MRALIPALQRLMLADKVAALRDPAAYPDATMEVEAVETHMPWVFLTDVHAYKLKKPVRYEGLDSAASRRAAFTARRSCGSTAGWHRRCISTWSRSSRAAMAACV